MELFYLITKIVNQEKLVKGLKRCYNNDSVAGRWYGKGSGVHQIHIKKSQTGYMGLGKIAIKINFKDLLLNLLGIACYNLWPIK